MSRSVHTTHKILKELTKSELDEQFYDPNSDLAKLAKKGELKRKIVKERKKILNEAHRRKKYRKGIPFI